MEKIVIDGATGFSQILVGERLANVMQYLPQNRVFVITDSNLASLYQEEFPDYPVFIVDPGEASKDFDVMIRIWHWLLEQGADRTSFILAIGGGVVCDLAGFVASTFMRGIGFGFVATSLLAQVDASVGGKNGVNLGGYKNIIGTFTQPSFVICDTQMLRTLPGEEYCNGMAEVIKHALIKDADKLDFLKENRAALLNRDSAAINEIVSRSVKIKAAVVQADERETGQRRLLNFGHTWGHAIEKVYKIPHGQAVSLGMIFACELSVHMGYLAPAFVSEIAELLDQYGLPVQRDLDKKMVFEALLKDKKKENRSIHYVLLKKPGEAFVEELSVKYLEEFVFESN